MAGHGHHHHGGRFGGDGWRFGWPRGAPWLVPEWGYVDTEVVDGAALLLAMRQNCSSWLATPGVARVAMLANALFGITDPLQRLSVTQALRVRAAMASIDSYCGYAGRVIGVMGYGLSNPVVHRRVLSKSGALQTQDQTGAKVMAAAGGGILAELGMTLDQWRALDPQQRIAACDELSRRMHAAAMSSAIDAYAESQGR